jgi:glycosyltransferase involved in cell wall biosynthesis
MKILQVCARYSPYIGGVEEHVKNISERMARENSVTVSTTDPSRRLLKKEIINQVIIRRFSSWAPDEAYYFSLGLKKFLDDNSNSFDVIHAHSYHSFPSLYAASTKRKKRFFFSPHYHGVGHSIFRNILHKPYKLLGKTIFEKADGIICVSEYERDLIQRNFKVDEAKVTVIPNGFNLEEFKGLSKEKKGSQFILCVGRAEEYKGLHYLIKVLPKIDQSISLHIVGKGPYKDTLIRLTKTLNVEDRVIFLQDLPRAVLLKEYTDASLFALLSQHEAYGISVGEALCAGTPCLVANASALKEWVDGKNCFGIDFPINLEELANLITRVIGTHIDTNRTVLLDWAEIAKKLCTMYESV